MSGKSYIHVLMILAVAVLAASGPLYSAEPRDTFHTETYAMEAYLADPDLALGRIDSAVAAGNVLPYRARYLRACVHWLFPERADSVLILCGQLLKDPVSEADVQNRSDVRRLLLNYYRRRGDHTNVIRMATDLARIYHEEGKPVGERLMRVEEATSMIYLDNGDEGFARIDEAVAELDVIESWSAMNATLYALRRKIYAYDAEGNDIGIRMAAEHMLHKIHDYEENPGIYGPDAESTGLESQEDRAGYVDWELAQIYAFMSVSNARLGDIPRGRHFAGLFGRTSSSRYLSQRALMLEAWAALDETEPLTNTIAELEEAWGSDTLTYNYAQLLKTRAKWAQSRGRLQESLGWWERYRNLQERLYKDQLRANAMESAIRFRLQEEEMARHDVEAERDRIWTISLMLVGVAVMLAFFAFWFWRERLALRQKNDELASVVRPLRQLAAFRRVTLAPGESRDVTLEIPYRQFGLWDRNLKFGVEEGWFEVWLGRDASQRIDGGRVYVW